MNYKIKYTAIVTGILLIGFVIGFLTNGRLVRSRIEKIQNFYTEKGVDRGFIRALDLTPDQMENIGPILQKHAEQNRNLVDSHRQEQQALFLDLKNKINPFLSEEQKEKMENMQHKWQQRFGSKSNHRGKGSMRERGKGQSRPSENKID